MTQKPNYDRYDFEIILKKILVGTCALVGILLVTFIILQVERARKNGFGTIYYVYFFLIVSVWKRIL